MGARGKPNPLIKPNALSRTASAGLVGLAIIASTVLGGGAAYAADPLVVDEPSAVVQAEAGQQILVAPSTLGFKVRQAVLLTMPLTGQASDAADRFAALAPIPLGAAREGRTFYSGRDIAEAAAPRLAEIGLPADGVDAVTRCFIDLVSIGNSVTVNAGKPEEEPPPPTTRESAPGQPRPTHPPQPGPTTSPGPTAPPSTPTTSAPAPTVSEVPAMTGALPPRLGELSGRSTPWAQARSGLGPNPDDLARQAEERRKAREQHEIRAAGKAEALPTQVTDRVAAPVLLAAIALAVVTAALVRSWVLRRH